MKTRQSPQPKRLEHLANEIRQLTESELDTLELLLDEEVTTELLKRQIEIDTETVKTISADELRRRLDRDDQG